MKGAPRSALSILNLRILHKSVSTFCTFVSGYDLLRHDTDLWSELRTFLRIYHQCERRRCGRDVRILCQTIRDLDCCAGNRCRDPALSPAKLSGSLILLLRILILLGDPHSWRDCFATCACAFNLFSQNRPVKPSVPPALHKDLSCPTVPVPSSTVGEMSRQPAPLIFIYSPTLPKDTIP